MISSDHNFARDQIAGLLTQHNGEYVLRIGQQPPQNELFSGDLTDDSSGWSGISRSNDDIEFIFQQITKTVEEVGGKVFISRSLLFLAQLTSWKTSVLFESKMGHPRTTLLLRLPPPNVSLTPEVRCAVVGNVDSGKSTTLGVLTRGICTYPDYIYHSHWFFAIRLA